MIADVMDANRTCTATITVKVVPYYTISGVVKSNNGLPISGVCVDFISPKEGEEVDSAYTSRRYNGASLQHGNGNATVAYYEAELPADTYIVKVEGDVTYEATSKLKVAKADKIANVTVPERYRIPMFLYYYEELSVKEIAHVTKSTEGTVKSLLSRGR